MLHPMRLLIIDDDATLAEVLADIATQYGWDVRTEVGEAAVTLARDWQPTLITLDLVMPGLDGWAVRQMLNQDPATLDIPVVVLTGVQVPDQDIDHLDVFAILPKPFELQTFAHILAAALDV